MLCNVLELLRFCSLLEGVTYLALVVSVRWLNLAGVSVEFPYLHEEI